MYLIHTHPIFRTQKNPMQKPLNPTPYILRSCIIYLMPGYRIMEILNFQIDTARQLVVVRQEKINQI